MSARVLSLAKSPFGNRLLRCLDGSCLALVESPQPALWSVGTDGFGGICTVTPNGNACTVRIPYNPAFPVLDWKYIDLALYIDAVGNDNLQVTLDLDDRSETGNEARVKLYTTGILHQGHGAQTSSIYWGDGGPDELSWGSRHVFTLPFWSCLVEIGAAYPLTSALTVSLALG